MREFIKKSLAEEFKPQLFSDASLNGLQIEGKAEISRLAVAVDAGESIFEQAISDGVDALFVHHGVFWGAAESISGAFKRKLNLLFKSDTSLFAMHLPLDAHATLGNNAQLAKILELSSHEAVAEYGGQFIGLCGENPKKHSVKDIVSQLSSSLPGADAGMLHLEFGPTTPERVCVVSGGGVDQLKNFEADRFDTLITGEPKQYAYHYCKENKLNAIFAGHYATETLGVQATASWLADKVSKASAGSKTLSWHFIDEPTGI